MLTPIADIHVFDDEDNESVVELWLNEILEKVALNRLVMNAPRLRKRTGYRSVRTRATVEALRSNLLPYNRRRREEGGGKEEKCPAELRLSKRGQSRQAKCSCRGARPGCRGNTGGGRGREGSAVRYANPRGLHRQVRSRI